MAPSATASTFQLGTWNALTDTFTQVLDLNDGATFAITNGGLKLPQPDKTIVMAGNVRTAGVVVPRWQYKERHIQVEVTLRGANVAAILTSVRALLAAVEQPPYCIRLAPPSSTQFSYADVQAVKHDIPNDPQILLAKAINKIHLDFTCATGLRGDRVTLQNLVVNPGFEQPSGPGVTVFTDGFANANAYSLLAGSAPTVASNVMTLAAGARVAFGSPAWGAIQTWQVRFKWVTGLTGNFHLHFGDANNTLVVTVSGTALNIFQTVAGSGHNLAGAAITPTNGNFYWLQMTQFPSAPNEVADVQATLFNDSAGAIGSVVASIGPAPTFDAVTALTGRPALEAVGAPLAVGGNFPQVQTVSLFGPGGWLTTNFSGVNSFAWEGEGGRIAPANTYPGGPVSSYGAARIDLHPTAGQAANAGWCLYNGGSLTGSFAIAATSGQTLRASVWVKSSGLGANAFVALIVREKDAGGASLRQTILQTANGNQGGWVQLAGSVVLGATTAYVDVLLNAGDTTGGSPGGTVWFDNVQCWNEATTAGATSMPYCELRFPQSPAQLLVSGVVGDLVAPGYLAAGTYLTNWPTGGSMQLYVGRKLDASKSVQLTGQSYGAFSAAFSPQATAALDSGSYGGFYSTAIVSTGGWNPRAFSASAWDAVGVYHLLARVYTAQTMPNLPNISMRVATAQQTDPWFNQVGGADIVGQWTGPFTFPFVAQNTWIIIDAGQCILPPFAQGARTDPSALFLTPRAQWQDTSGGGGAAGRISWQALLPIDGCLLMAMLNNPANGAAAVTNSWFWTYADGLLVNRGGANDIAAWTTSVEPAALPNPAAGAGGPGTQGSGAINVNSAADPYLTLDPTANNTPGMNVAAAGVNQIVAILADQAGAVLPFFGEIQYSPLYLYPR